jgi:maltose-binding protein MalE
VPIAGNVTVWHSFPDQERTAFNAIVNEFQAQYPAINFNAEFIPFDAIRETYETASANGNAPSIILGPLDWSAIFLEAGYTQDVSDLVSGATWAALRPVVVTNVQYKGQAVGVPFAAKGIVMYRNLNQIRVAPSTFEQVIALSPDYDFERGLYYSGGTLEALGGQLMDADGNPTFNNATGVEWVERVNQFNDPQNYGDNDINAFIAGDVSLIIDGTWNLQRIVNGAGTQNVEINALPIGSAGFTLSDLAMLSANVNQADIAANIAFMEFMASDEAQSILTVVGGRVPARTDTRIPSEHLRQAAIALDKGARFPIEPEMEAYWGPLTVALDNAYNGADPAQELQRAADEILTELGR